MLKFHLLMAQFVHAASELKIASTLLVAFDSAVQFQLMCVMLCRGASPCAGRAVRFGMWIWLGGKLC